MKTRSQRLAQDSLFRNSIPALGTLRIASNVADGETITIGSTVFEVDTNSAITAGRVAVDCSGGVTPTLFGDAFVAAVNAQTGLGVKAYKVSANIVVLYDAKPGRGATLATTETLAGANNGFAATTLVRTGPPQSAANVAIQQRACNALEDTLEVMAFYFPFTVASVLVQVRRAGVIRAWDGAVTAPSGGIVVLSSSGTTDIDENDVVTVVAA